MNLQNEIHLLVLVVAVVAAVPVVAGAVVLAAVAVGLELAELQLVAKWGYFPGLQTGGKPGVKEVELEVAQTQLHLGLGMESQEPAADSAAEEVALTVCVEYSDDK